MMGGKATRGFWLAILIVAIGIGTTANAGTLLVGGSPIWEQSTGNGMRDGDVRVVPGSGVNNSGTAIGAPYWCVNGSNTGICSVRWDGSGTSSTQLDSLGVLGPKQAIARGFAGQFSAAA
jgi:hypothetical protein